MEAIEEIHEFMKRRNELWDRTNKLRPKGNEYVSKIGALIDQLESLPSIQSQRKQLGILTKYTKN